MPLKPKTYVDSKRPDAVARGLGINSIPNRRHWYFAHCTTCKQDTAHLTIFDGACSICAARRRAAGQRSG